MTPPMPVAWLQIRILTALQSRGAMKVEVEAFRAPLSNEVYQTVQRRSFLEQPCERHLPARVHHDNAAVIEDCLIVALAQRLLS